MALMTSATEILFRQAEAKEHTTAFAEIFSLSASKWLGGMLDDPRKAATMFRLRRAPQTDDMRQMLDDIGVTPAGISPSRRPPSERFSTIKITTRYAWE